MSFFLLFLLLLLHLPRTYHHLQRAGELMSGRVSDHLNYNRLCIYIHCIVHACACACVFVECTHTRTLEGTERKQPIDNDDNLSRVKYLLCDRNNNNNRLKCSNFPTCYTFFHPIQPQHCI